PRNRVTISRCRIRLQQVQADVTAEADPREEEDEAEQEPTRLAPVGLLLAEQVARSVHHRRDQPIEMSTLGTSRSPGSVISHSSAGVALARPATRLVGNCCCATLYVVATSL